MRAAPLRPVERARWTRRAPSSRLSIAALLALATAPPLLAQEAPRAQGPGYSVPIPAGFHADSTSSDFARSLWARGGVLLAHDSAPARINVTIVPAGSMEQEAGHGHDTPEGCREFASSFARAMGFDLERAAIAETPVGSTCQIAVVDRPNAHAATFTMMSAGPAGFGVTCNYHVRDGDTPPWCREVIDGWRTELLQYEGTAGIARYDPQEAPDGEFFATDAIDEMPQVLSSPPVTYPPVLLEAGVEGSVTLAVVVGTDGRIEPSSIRVVESTHPGFEQAAADALLATVFRPGKINGQPVRVIVQLPIAFSVRQKPQR
jgi:TonB family protein